MFLNIFFVIVCGIATVWCFHDYVTSPKLKTSSLVIGLINMVAFGLNLFALLR